MAKSSDYNVPLELPDSLPSGGLTGQVLKKVSDTDQDADWQDEQEIPEVALDYIFIWDEKPQGTAGGFGTTGNNIRDLNIQSGSVPLVDLSANSFVLPVGTWYIRAIAPSYRTSNTTLQLISDTDPTVQGTTINLGTTEFVISHSEVNAVVISDGVKSYQLNHYFSASQGSTSNLGSPSNSGVSIYAHVSCIKIGEA